MVKPLVTVVTPVYNRAGVVSRAIESILEQTFVNYEYILVNDGSTDRTGDVLREYALRDSRLKIIDCESNEGVSRAYQRGLDAASGKYIAILDSDDEAVPNRLELQAAVLERQQDVAMVSGIAEWVDESGGRIGCFPGILCAGAGFPGSRKEMFEMQYLWGPKIVNSSVMFRKSLLKNHPTPYGSGRKMTADWEFFLHVCRNYDVVGLKRVLVRMARSGSRDSLTTNRDVMHSYARQTIRNIYFQYRSDDIMKVSRSLYRRAMSNQRVVEARANYTQPTALVAILQAIALFPMNRYAWDTIAEFGQRAVNRLIRKMQL